MGKVGTRTGLEDSGETYINPAKEDGNLANLVGFEISAYDYIVLTYISAGNGTGEIETVVYKNGGVSGSVVATLTIAYNASNEISSITKT